MSISITRILKHSLFGWSSYRLKKSTVKAVNWRRTAYVMDKSIKTASAADDCAAVVNESWEKGVVKDV